MSKNVDVKVTFVGGNSIIAKVNVNKGKYASMQSKACTKSKALLSKVLLGNMTREAATEEWNAKIRTPWVEMVSGPLMETFPQEVTNMIEEIVPETSLIDFNCPEVPAKQEIV